MSCFSPLTAYKAKSKNAEKMSLVFSRPQSWRGEVLNLPCGQCIGCRLERSRQWATRCMHEASLYENNSFVTLTYDDAHLPAGRTLVKQDLPLFMKRLRKEFGPGIRYYGCGEYGDQLARPHYHALLFNHAFSDKSFFSHRNGNSVYTSAVLDSLWGKGFAVTGEVTFESAAYVARYVMKKITGPRAESHYGGRVPEFTLMSRGSKKLGTGGIGKGWYDLYKSDVYPHDRVVVRGVPTRPPRFYDSLFSREDRSTLELLKIKREVNGRRFVDDVLSNGRRVRVSDSSSIRLPVRELCVAARVSNLKRPLEEL